MSEQKMDCENTARQLYDAFNSRDFERALSFVAHDAEFEVVPFGLKLRGQDGFRQFLQMWATGFPDAKVDVTSLFSTGDRVCSEFTGHGNNTGPLDSPTGRILPTGKHMSLKFCEVLQFRNGKVVQAHTYFDVASMMSQLGLLPESRQAGR